jgi:hypothetical protein
LVDALAVAASVTKFHGERSPLILTAAPPPNPYPPPPLPRHRRNRRFDHEHGTFDDALRAGRPGDGAHIQLLLERLQDVGGELIVLPALVVEGPGLQLHIHEPPRLHRFDGPVLRIAQSRRSGEARTVHVGELV